MRLTSHEDHFPITEEEFERQQSILDSLREKHNAELFKSGLITRALGSKAMCNHFSYRGRVTEGTLFYPSKAVPDTAINWVGGSAGLDATLATIQMNVREVERMPSNPDAISTIIKMTRIDPDESGFTRSAFVIGLSPFISAPHELIRTNVIPTQGLIADDVLLVASQLQEIQRIKAAEGFSIINPFSLSESEEDKWII